MPLNRSGDKLITFPIVIVNWFYDFIIKNGIIQSSLEYEEYQYESYITSSILSREQGT